MTRFKNSKKRIIFWLLVVFNCSLTGQNILTKADLISGLESGRQALNSGNVIESISIAQQAVIFAKKHKYKLELAEAYSLLGNGFRIDGKFDLSIFFHRNALRIRHSYGSRELPVYANSCYNIANSFLVTSEMDSALIYYQRALAIRNKYKTQNPQDWLQSLRGMGNFWLQNSNPDSALFFLNEALNASKTQDLEYGGSILTYLTIGNAFFEQGAPLKSLHALNKALELFKLSKYPDLKLKSMVFNNKGNVYASIGKIKEALGNYQTAIDIREQLQDSTLLSESWSNLAGIYNNLGDVKKTILLCKRAIRFTPLSQPFERGNRMALLGEALLRDKQNNEGIKMLEYAISLHLGFKHVPDEILANDFFRLANGYFTQRNWKAAEFYYKKSLTKTSEKKNRSIVPVLYCNLALCACMQNDVQRAKTLFNQSTQSPHQTSREKASCFLRMGDAFYAQKKYEDAFYYSKLALQYQNEAFGAKLGSSTKALLLENLEALSLHIQTTALLAKQNPWIVESTQAHFNNALSLLYGLKGYYQEKESKQILLDQFYGIFEGLLKCYWDTKANQSPEIIWQAFQLAEESKNVILNEQLEEHRQRNKIGVSAQMAYLESMEKELAFFELQYDQAELSVVQQNMLNSNIDSLKERIQNFKLKEGIVQFGAKKHREKGLGYLSKVRITLGKDQGLVTYFIGEQFCFGFCLTRDTFYWQQLEAAQGITMAADSFMMSIRRPANPFDRSFFEKQCKSFAKNAFHLFNTLVAPFIADLPSRVIIVPDGKLGNLPFEAFLTQPVTRIDRFATMPYLVKDHAISYAYAANLPILARRVSSTPQAIPILIMAPSLEDNISGFPPLKHTIEEARAIKRLIPRGKLVKGSSATKAYFRQKASRSRILHLATHAQAHSTNGNYSAIAFTAHPAQKEEGLLYVREIYTMHLNAEMVVLSACETGSGELRRGEGIISLSRAFFAAGAESVLATAWQIRDKRTKELIEGYYHYLGKNYSKDLALQKAKIDFINQYSQLDAHPFYWSAFLLHGSDAPIRDIFTAKPPLIQYGLGILLLGIAVGWLYWRFTKNKKD